jgi:hypothetical protein
VGFVALLLSAGDHAGASTESSQLAIEDGSLAGASGGRSGSGSCTVCWTSGRGGGA